VQFKITEPCFTLEESVTLMKGGVQMGLKEYNKRRDFRKTSEPKGESKTSTGNTYVIHKHKASRLHYDLRLQIGEVLASWAVPKGPSYNPSEKRLAVHVEDHPVNYADFEGIIPEDEYGGGTVMIWDRGEWECHGDPEEGMKKGKISFTLRGNKLNGNWALVKMKGKKRGEDNWLFFKEKDDTADSNYDVVSEEPESASSGRTLDEIAEEEGGKE
jgi:bifunctional non-homologous end joining protein LigD